LGDLEMTRMPSSAGSFEDMMRIFEYDRRLPLNVEDKGVEYRDGISVRDLSYAGLAGKRISAYLVQPSSKDALAGLVFVHPAPGSRSSFLDEAATLARMGTASLLINAPWAYAEFGEQASKMRAEDIRNIFVQATREIRRGVDLILAQGTVDENRIGYVGHSLGALLGGILSSVERRIRAFVLMAGTGSFADVALLNMPDLKGQGLEEYRQTMELIDPVYYVSRATPSALFFQFGLQDLFYPRQKFLDYYEAGSEPKSIRWYEADHYRLNEEGRSDRIEWLRTQLRLVPAR
jgi:cephalosporin-C deacetylase-like acetyl esterase